MNVYVLVAGVLTLLTFFVHTFVGTFETLQTKVDFKDSKVEKNWYQSLQAWHLITAYLLFTAILLFVIAASDVLEDKKTIAFIIGGQFFFWSISWLITLFTTNSRKYWTQLFHWTIFLAISLLLFYGGNRFE